MKRRTKKRPSATHVRNLADYNALSFDDQLLREKALRALGLMRRHGYSKARAAREADISPNAFQRIAGKALVKEGGRYRASSSDRFLRVFVVPVPRGKTEVVTRSTRLARQISDYDNALSAYANKGDYSKLRRFEGVTFWAGGRRYEFLTDRRQLDPLLRAGELSFESIYARRA